MGAPGRLAAMCVLCLAVVAPACGGGPSPPNLVVVLADALRADHLGVYGYARQTSPTIDAFARENVFFESARSQAPCTFPSVNSLLTSRDPIRFTREGHNRKLGLLGIPGDLPTLAGILRDRGFRTLAVSESPIVRRSPTKFNREGGFGRGFDRFDESCFRGDFVFDGRCVNERALALLDEVVSDRDGAPFFLYLHYMQTHDRYHPPAAHVRRFARSYAGKRDFIREGNPNPVAKMIYRPGGRSDWLDESDRQHLVDLYDDEIAYLDELFGSLVSALGARGLWERTIVVLLADHGEDFLEHRDIKHCRSLYDTQIRTPLLMHVPGRGTARVSAPVQNLDVVPTLLDYAGLDASGYDFDGRSLRAAIEAAVASPAPDSSQSASPDAAFGSFSSWGSQRAVVEGGFKLVLDLDSGDRRLFSLADDPLEQHDLAGRRPEEAARLEASLRERVARLEGSSGGASDHAGDIETELRSLGYLE